MSNIEGIPEGWELVRVGKPIINVDCVVNRDGTAVLCEVEHFAQNWPIIRKIENPKQYRPFANAAEFKPHRDRWLTHPRGTQCEGAFQVTEYDDKGFLANGITQKMLYETAYSIGLRFDNLDGTTEPFGVEVTS